MSVEEKTEDIFIAHTTQNPSFDLLGEDSARQMVDEVLQGDGDPQGLCKLLLFLRDNETDLAMCNALDLLLEACYHRSKEHSEGLARYLEQCRNSHTANEAIGTI